MHNFLVVVTSILLASISSVVHAWTTNTYCRGSVSQSTPLFESTASYQNSDNILYDDSADGNNPISITLKIAVDQNMGAADLSAQKSERFTCSQALDMVHRLRRDCDAVLVGKGTVLADNPSLTVRRVPPKINNNQQQQPLRVVLDPKLAIMSQKGHQDLVLLQDGYNTVVYHDNAVEVPEQYIQAIHKNVHFVPIEVIKNRLSLSAIVQDLQQRFNVKHIMVEGGPTTAMHFLREQWIDRVILVKAPVSFRQPLPSGLSANVFEQAGLMFLGEEPCGDDTIEYWSRPHLPWPSNNLSDWP